MSECVIKLSVCFYCILCDELSFWNTTRYRYTWYVR